MTDNNVSQCQTLAELQEAFRNLPPMDRESAAWFFLNVEFIAKARALGSEAYRFFGATQKNLPEGTIFGPFGVYFYQGVVDAERGWSVEGLHAVVMKSERGANNA